jgi:DNA-binding CsgD family transcriptional regulator
MAAITPTMIDSVRIATADDVTRAALALRALADAAGMRVAPAHNIALKQPMLDEAGEPLATSVFGWSDCKVAWWKSPRLALDSPIPAACRYEAEPFWVNAEGFRTHQPNHFLTAIDLSNFAQRALTQAAIVAPVHLPFGQIGAVSFNPIDEEVTDLAQPFAEWSDLFGLAARTFVGSYVRVACRAQRLPAGSRLSKREVECLKWAAIGKTDQEISMIMARSRATVRFHIHNASIKLDAVNRSQTVFKAAQLGYIGLQN